MELKLLDSQYVGAELGMTQEALRGYLFRHPELRPGHKVGQAYLWTQEEFKRLQEHRRYKRWKRKERQV